MASRAHLETLPAHWRGPAAAGLAAAALAPTAPLAPLKGGVSGALICRVETREGRFLLRLEPARVALEHRERNFTCMRVAAEAGVAPALRYSDPTAGVAVMDFIEARPLAEHPSGRDGVVRELGGLVARIQAGPAFPMLGDGRDTVQLLLDGLAASGLFAPGLLEPHAEALARLRAARPWNVTALVPSHNDPNPRNLIYDGRRVWLVDWELAAQNDPLFDLAIATFELADTPTLRAALLTSALGHEPEAGQLAELAVVCLLARLFYGCIALEAFAHQPRAEPLDDLAALTPAEFSAAVADGSLGGATKPEETAFAFGLMSLRALLDGAATA